MSILAISSVVICLFILFRWLSLNRDFSSFVCLPESRVIEEVFNRQFEFQKGGYDGFYFYSYAHNPLAIPTRAFDKKNKDTVYHIQGIIQAKNYPFRKKRIGYSTAVWVISGLGNSSLIPISLVLVNLIAFLGLILIAQQFFKLYKLPESWAFYALTFVGAYVCVARDLADLMGMTLAFWAFLLIEKRKIWFSALITFLALMTKENVAFFLAIPMAVHLITDYKKSFKSAILSSFIWGAPFMLYILWNFYLKNESADLAGYHSPIANFTWPFYGLFTSFNGSFTALLLSSTLTVSIYCLVVEAGVDLFKKFRTISSQVGLSLAGIFLVYLFISICFSYKIYEDHWSLGRNLLPLQLSAFLWLIWSKRKMSRINLLIGILTSIIYFVLLAMYP